jgi:hypothetical protein
MILFGYGPVPNGSRDATFVTKIIGPAQTFGAIAGQRFRNRCSLQVAERRKSDGLEVRKLVIFQCDDSIFIEANHRQRIDGSLQFILNLLNLHSERVSPNITGR